jgi:hypothetical protein
MDPARALVTYPTVRNDDPASDDWGVVARLVGPPIPIEFAQPTIGTLTIVPASLVTVVLLAANADRLGALIHNNSPSRFLHVRLGPGATTSAFTARLPPQSLFTLPFPAYTGVITGIWTAGSPSDAQVTELT